VLPTLPLLDEGLQLRSSQEIAERILAMNVVAAAAYGFDKTRAIAWLKQERLVNSLTEEEKLFVFEGGGQSDRFKLQIEGMWALAWAMGMVKELDFATDCDSRFAQMLPNLKQNASSAAFRQQIRPRPLEQTVAACDLAYCLHWAIRDTELTGKRALRNLKPYVVVERRRALEWALSTEDWDEVSLDT
jgi:hypothetical protein